MLSSVTQIYGGSYRRLSLYVSAILIIFVSTLTYLMPHSLTSSSTASSPMLTKPSVTPDQKYLAYLPHSGLSNQRISLTNALLMAAVLNRTLIIPPAFLGTVMGWSTRGPLTRSFEWLTVPKEFDTLCPTEHNPTQPSSYVASAQCQSYHHIGIIHWSDLHDLESLRPFVSFQYHNIVSLDYLAATLGLCRHHLDHNTTDAEEHQYMEGCDEIYVYDDKIRYDWRLFEDEKVRQDMSKHHSNYVKRPEGKKYYKVMTWDDWQKRPEKLIYLGSTFGSTRMNLIEPQHRELKKRIMKALIYRMDTPIGQTVKDIMSKYLNDSYAAVHFRTGDEQFRKGLASQLRHSIKEMSRIIETKPSDKVSSFCSALSSSSSNNMNSNNTGTRNMVNIFMATDHHHPRDSNSTLEAWFQHYPCTMTLADIPSEFFRPLDRVFDLIHPQKPLKGYLMPLVDAMVAAHADDVVLNRGSTFSGYIIQLHRAWQKRH